MERSLTVVDSKGAAIAGKVEIRDHETEWRFTPMNAWKNGSYELRAGPTLEDVAGNRADRLFDTPGPITNQEAKYSRSFEIAIAIVPG